MSKAAVVYWSGTGNRLLKALWLITPGGSILDECKSLGAVMV